MLSIGNFARLGHISVRMLRHYDAIGLLRPAKVDADTGYRSYDWTQLETLGRIRELADYRFPLSRVAELLQMDDMALRPVLQEKRISLYRELARTQQIIRRLEHMLGPDTKRGAYDMSQSYQVTIMETQPQRIFGISKHIHIGQVHELFQELHAEMQKRGLTPAGAGLFFSHGEEYSYEDIDAEAAFPVNGEHPDTRIMPGGPYVATMHRGPYETVSGAYEAIGKYLSEHPEWEVVGPGFERYIRDENDGVPPEEFETGILFQVKKKEA